MQKLVYQCDHCKKETSGKNISIRFSTNSGVAVPPARSGIPWRVVPSLDGHFMHFCNPECLKKFFTKLFKEAK